MTRWKGKHIGKPLLPFFLLIFSHQAQAYGVSFILTQPNYAKFGYNGYAYSSLFPQGRDNFHWLDLTYADYDYVLSNERGQAQEIGTLYRFSHRLRWSRHFKPHIFTGFGAIQLTRTGRIRVNDNNVLITELPKEQIVHYRIFGGVGYLWGIKNMLLGVTVDYGYDHGYAQSFLAPSVLFSFVL